MFFSFSAQHLIRPRDVHSLQGEGKAPPSCCGTFNLTCYLYRGDKLAAVCLLQPTMLQWIELLTKQFNNSQAACEV